MSDSESTTAWVTVAEAAEKAQVDSGTVRQWYRSGRIPTRRAEGERGAFLVPLDLVLSLVQPAEAAPAASSAAPSIEDVRLGVVADTSAETEALRKEVADAREQLEFLRAQLAEATGENRRLKQQLEVAEDQRADLRAQLADAVDDRKGVEARLLTVESELTQLRRQAARSSITDNSWLDLQTPAYESPVRRQAMSPAPERPAADRPAAAPAVVPPPGGPTAPFAEARTSELADLLAATRPDGADADADGVADGEAPTAASSPPRSSAFPDDGFDDRDDTASARIWTDEAPHPPLGESPDDLLPDIDRKGRFGKK